MKSRRGSSRYSGRLASWSCLPLTRHYRHRLRYHAAFAQDRFWDFASVKLLMTRCKTPSQQRLDFHLKARIGVHDGAHRQEATDGSPRGLRGFGRWERQRWCSENHRTLVMITKTIGKSTKAERSPIARRVSGFKVVRRRLRLSGPSVTLPTAEPKPRPSFRPGSRVARDWHGGTHTVVFLDCGVEWRGKRCKSLSVVAREIAGAHWSGPRSFRLTVEALPRHSKRVIA